MRGLSVFFQPKIQYTKLNSMRIIVTHASPDLDAITSVWLIKRFLPGWEEAEVKFVPAGERLRLSVFGSQSSDLSQSVDRSTGKQVTDKLKTENRQLKTDNRDPIELIDGDEVIHVDTGLGPLDHHQTDDQNLSAASLTWDYIQKIRNSKFESRNLESETERVQVQKEAIDRIVKVVVDVDHFKEVFWPDPTADHYEFSILGIIDGLKVAKPDKDEYYIEFVSECLDAILHKFENRIWAEKEAETNGKQFETKFGKGLGIETVNDGVIDLAQKKGFVIVVRKDPRKGYVRIKASPLAEKEIDLTAAYEQLKKMDPQATWFLHVSKKMLLNGTAKNPRMKPTNLGLDAIIRVLETV